MLPDGPAARAIARQLGAGQPNGKIPSGVSVNLVYVVAVKKLRNER